MPVSPSLLVAVTVYVKDPAAEVLSCPGLVEPSLSVHDAIPGPSAPSAQPKLVGTDCPTL